MRKPRSNAVLKTLSDERQSEIIEYLRDHSLSETRAWLREGAAPVKTSLAALSEFHSWYSLRQSYRNGESAINGVLEEIARNRPDLSQDDLFAMGQRLFSALAIAKQDASSWTKVQRVQLQHRGVTVDERKIALLEKKAALADAAEAVVKEQLTPEQQMARMREIFGIG